MKSPEILTLRFRSIDGRFHSGRPVYAIEETDERLVTFMPEGTTVSEPVLMDGRGLRDVPLGERWAHPRTSRLRPWHGTELIQIFPKGRAHSLWVVRDADHALRGWYVNLEEEHVFTGRTITTQDHVLDIWVPGETGEPEWKDEDELAAALDAGRLTPEQAAAVGTEGERVWRERPWPTGWEEWQPPDALPRPELPPGWQAEELTTGRLVLMPLTNGDLADYTGLRGDPRTRVFSRSGVPVPAEQAHRELDESSASWHANGFGNWRGQLHDGTFVGVIHAVAAGEPPSPELGWTLAPEHWGQGLATEAARAVAADLFDRARVSHITSFLQTANTASARIAEKLGMRLVERVDGVDRYELRPTP